jgi:hypothetical protein
MKSPVCNPESQGACFACGALVAALNVEVVRAKRVLHEIRCDPVANRMLDLLMHDYYRRRREEPLGSDQKDRRPEVL